MPELELKRCCGWKNITQSHMAPLTQFGPHRGTPDGLHNVCKVCKKLADAVHNKKTGDRQFARIGIRGILPEWKIQEIEANRKWAKDHSIGGVA